MRKKQDHKEEQIPAELSLVVKYGTKLKKETSLNRNCIEYRKYFLHQDNGIFDCNELSSKGES